MLPDDAVLPSEPTPRAQRRRTPMTALVAPRRSVAWLRRAASLVLGAGLALAALGAVAAADQHVKITDSAYEPANVTITAGETVTWQNAGSRPHTVTADDGSFDSGPLSTSDAFANLFGTAGTFTYHSTGDPASMKGTVIVMPAPATPQPSGTPPPSPPSGTLPPSFLPRPTATPGPSQTSTAAATPAPGHAGGLGGSGLLLPLIVVLLLAGAGALAYLTRRRSAG